MEVKGSIDQFTRCTHYHSELDVIAIKFSCCGEFFSCYECHRELAGHPAQVWKKKRWDEKAVRCGLCRYEMTVHEYLQCGYRCPSCRGNFNPRCSNHNHLYFESEL